SQGEDVASAGVVLPVETEWRPSPGAAELAHGAVTEGGGSGSSQTEDRVASAPAPSDAPTQAVAKAGAPEEPSETSAPATTARDPITSEAKRMARRARLANAEKPPAPPPRTAERHCTTYKAPTSLTGTSGPVRGVACRQSDGHWLVLSESPAR